LLLSRVADDGDPADTQVGALDAAIGALAAELGRHEHAIAHWTRAADRMRDPLERAAALQAVARSAFALDDPASARTYLERSRAADSNDKLLELERRALEAGIGLWIGEEDRAAGRALAHEVAAEARRMARAAGGIDALQPRARHAYLEALRVEHETAFQEDEVEVFLRIAEERATVARGFDHDTRLSASIEAGRALTRLGRLDEAEQRLRAVWDEARQLVLPQLTIDAAYSYARVLEQRGRVHEAEDVVAEAEELAQRVGDEARGRHRISRLAGEIAFHRGNWREAVASLLGEARQASTHGRVQLHQDAAVWLALAGGEAVERDVLAQLGEARACAEAAGCPRCKAELPLAAAEALVRVGRRDEAAQALEEWERLQERPQARDLFLRRRIVGLLAASDTNGRAEATLEHAAREADARGLALDALWTRIDLGLTVARRDPDRGVEILREAAASAAAMGAITEKQVAEQGLRGLGVRTWRRGAAAETLTEREQEIAALVSAGASNPEIAQTLFLSRKTIERHVSNLLRKVGVRNRAELAAKMAELKLEGAPR